MWFIVLTSFMMFVNRVVLVMKISNEGEQFLLDQCNLIIKNISVRKQCSYDIYRQNWSRLSVFNDGFIVGCISKIFPKHSRTLA